MTSKLKGVFGALRRWRGLLLALAALVALVWVDVRVKTTDIAGYCPENASWVAAAEDFGVFWLGVSRSDAIRRVQEEVPHPLHAFELATRKATGIRPTPIRWRVWMGYRFVAAGCEEGMGVCVRPGILMRAVDLFRRHVLRVRAEDGICRFGDLFYGWRGGFLIFSKTRAYVVASMDAPEPSIDGSQGPDELRIHWRGDHEALLRFRGAEGLPVAGWLRAKLGHRGTPLRLAQAWPEPPLFSITAAKWEDLCAVSRFVGEAMGDMPGWEQAGGLTRFVWRRWRLGALPEGWDRGVREWAFGIVDIDTSETVPVPEAALIALCAGAPTGAHPLLAPVGAWGDGVPFEWGTYPGLFVPLIGEKFALCLGRDDRHWLATSRELTMTGLVGRLRETAPIDADVAVRVDWRKLGETAEELLQNGARMELVPRMNAQEVEQKLLPLTRALAKLGALELEGESQDDRLAFKGFLAFADKGAG